MAGLGLAAGSLPCQVTELGFFSHASFHVSVCLTRFGGMLLVSHVSYAGSILLNLGICWRRDMASQRGARGVTPRRAACVCASVCLICPSGW